MHIPEEKISEVLNASDIVDVISESVILKKAGTNYFGLCPFHSEKTPSFSVNPGKQIFHCFGCSAGGNVLSYLMKYHGISFPEAVKMAARKYSIEIENPTFSPSMKKEMEIKEALFRINQTVMGYYHDVLRGSHQAEAARDYLKKEEFPGRSSRSSSWAIPQRAGTPSLICLKRIRFQIKLPSSPGWFWNGNKKTVFMTGLETVSYFQSLISICRWPVSEAGSWMTACPNT